MNKRSLHHFWTIIRPVNTAYLLLAFLLCATVAAVSLRQNYQTMTELKAAVYQADKDNVNLEQALQQLRSFVVSHMNTDLYAGNGIYPPIHLKYTYDRLVAAEQERAASANAQIYTNAQAYCEQLYPKSFSGGPRVPCIEEYVKTHGTAVKTIPDALYKFNFSSPRWSPDLAGWALVFSMVFLILATLRWTVGHFVKKAMRN